MSRETLIVIFFICSVGLALWFFFSPEIAKASDKKQIKEYKNGLARNANFINFIMNELPISRPELIKVSHARLMGDVDIVGLLEDNNFLKNAGYTEENMKDLLKLDMRCRRIWGVTLKQSDLKYNKTFDPK
ncbi:hypothetical protein OAN79_00600 [Candidatus Pelagibacter sp.]|nr:hypothetical protein [Candidatus Pelagibacter sp.]